MDVGGDVKGGEGGRIGCVTENKRGKGLWTWEMI